MVTQPVAGMDRGAINALGHALQSLRLHGEDIIISVGAHNATPDCSQGYVSATLLRGDDEGLGEAISLDDAIRLARGVLNENAAKRAKEAAEAKAAKTARVAA